MAGKDLHNNMPAFPAASIKDIFSLHESSKMIPLIWHTFYIQMVCLQRKYFLRLKN